MISKLKGKTLISLDLAEIPGGLALLPFVLPPFLIYLVNSPTRRPDIYLPSSG